MTEQDDVDFLADMAALGAAATEASDEQLHPAIRESAATAAEQIADEYRE
ncbi:hypothetical protein [Streptomyces sp. IBSBF 2435]